MYCWVPSHVGIYGNEQVDKKAKESLNLEQTVFKIPFVNFKKVEVGKDQEKAQSEKDSHSKNRGGKKPN